MVQTMVDAGAEFQRLEILLRGFALDEAIKSGMDFDAAMRSAVNTTKEQLEWLQTLGAATPFDPTAISNIFTMARSYGFAADEAKRLTSNVINYTAGMGLGNEVLERVIVNMGQMIQRGKITRTEIRDLTRGAMLPWADILERLAEKLDMTTEDVDKLIDRDWET